MDEPNMTKEDVRNAYTNGDLGYDSAIRILMDQHNFTEYAADQYLFS
jgi:hypothetical protein